MNQMAMFLRAVLAFSTVGIPLSIVLAVEHVFGAGMMQSKHTQLVIYLSFIMFGMSLFISSRRTDREQSVFSPKIAFYGLPQWFTVTAIAVGAAVFVAGLYLILSPPAKKMNTNITIRLLTASLLYMVAAGGFWSSLRRIENSHKL